MFAGQQNWDEADKLLHCNLERWVALSWQEGLVNPPKGIPYGTHLATFIYCHPGEEIKGLNFCWLIQSGEGHFYRACEPMVGIEATWLFRYVTPLTNERAKRMGKAITTAWRRSREIISESVFAWVEKKFNSTAKTRVRERLWPGLQWQKKLVYGGVRYSDEVDELEKHITLVPFYEVLRDLRWGRHELFSATGTDIANIVEYYEDCAASRQRGESKK